MDILAFYLSKFDLEAVHQLNYSTRTEAFQKLSLLFDRNDNYLKLRRDEYDVLTDSHRNGWRNRPPAKSVMEMYEYLQQFTFNELTAFVKSLIENTQDEDLSADKSFMQNVSSRKIQAELSEEEMEILINQEDTTADLVIVSGNQTRRIYKRSIIIELKKLYRYECQICGHAFEGLYGGNYAEAHHIEFFADTHNNKMNNIIILCPNHHRVIHLLKPNFDRHSLTWVYPNGLTESLKKNIHLEL